MGKKSFIIILYLYMMVIGCKQEYKHYSYYMSGKPQSELIFSSKKEKMAMQNYTAIIYYENGNIQTKCKFKNGHLNDDVWLYYENGKVKAFSMYKNDTLHGIYRQYSPMGMLTNENLYLNGTKIASMKTSYYNNGHIEYVYHIQNQNTHQDRGSYGFLTYDSTKQLVETRSFGCEVIGKDTIREGDIYSLSVTGYTAGLKSFNHFRLTRIIFGDFEHIPIHTFDSSYTIIKAEGNKAIYNFEPNKLGYNFIVGEAHLQDEQKADSSYVMWHFYKLFYMKGKDEK